MNWCRWMVVAAVLLGGVWAAFGQPSDDGGASPYFDCPYVNYFDTDCPQLREQRRGMQGRQAAPEPRPGSGAVRRSGQQRGRPR